MSPVMTQPDLQLSSLGVRAVSSSLDVLAVGRTSAVSTIIASSSAVRRVVVFFSQVSSDMLVAELKAERAREGKSLAVPTTWGWDLGPRWLSGTGKRT